MKLILLISCFTICSSFNILDPLLSLTLKNGKQNKKSPSGRESNGFCGVFPKSCPETTDRSIDGSCNNLKNPSWGTPYTSYVRFCSRNYGDGISSLPTSKSGSPLKSAREISLLVAKNNSVEDTQITLAAMQFMQLLAHDMSFIAGTEDAPSCCQDGQDVGTDSRCANIPVPPDDPVHADKKCLNFVRTETTKDNNCTAAHVPVDPINVVTPYLDASFLYGSTDSEAKSLRTMHGGKLKSVIRNDQEWPPQVSQPTQICKVKSNKDPCYDGGDSRINQNTQLTMIQVLFLRKHNKLAEDLHQHHKCWSDEKLYQKVRQIIIACWQHIIYYELLPTYLGRKNMIKNKLIYDKPEGHINDYDAEANPGVSVEHASIAFRYPHSAIAGRLKMYDENEKYAGAIRLSSWMHNPSILEENRNFDKLAKGICVQPQMAMDTFFDREITTYLSRGDNKFGTDLRALDYQRARDHGASTYNDLRECCGLPRAKTFNDFCDHISEENVKLLQKIYQTPVEVEASVAGPFEIPVHGALFGPTFQCVIMEQFKRSRQGDRLFYESGNHPGALTPDQLSSVRTQTIARLFCDTTGVKEIQLRALELISDDNPVVPCHLIPTLDYSLW